MKRALAAFGCFALIALAMAPFKPYAQLFSGEPGAYSEDPGMGLEKGTTWREIMEESYRQPLMDDAYTTISQSTTYRLSNLDNQLTAKAIAWEQVKALIVDELMNLINVEAKAAKNVSKKVYGKSQGLSYELLPNHDAIKTILPSIISIEQIDESRKKNSIKLKAKSKVALSKIVPAMTKIYSQKDMYDEIAQERRLATDAMDKLMQLQAETSESGDKSALSEPYLDAAHRLMAADQMERARLFALAHQTQEAVNAYTKALAHLPGLGIAYRNRASLYAFLKDNSRAVADYLQAFSSDAIDHMELKEFSACIEDAEAAMKLYEDYAVAYYQRAVCRVGLGQQTMAKADFIKAAQLGDAKARSLLERKGIKW